MTTAKWTIDAGVVVSSYAILLLQDLMKGVFASVGWRCSKSSCFFCLLCMQKGRERDLERERESI
jgi:hypothetical protein